MTVFSRPLIILMLGSLWLSPATQASNLTQESLIADEIKRTLKDGEAIELAAANLQFLAVYQETSLPAKKGGVIILHGTDQNPDSPGVIRILRTGLSKSGWDTLSLQMPIPILNEDKTDPTTLIQEGIPRIEAATRFFSDKDNTNLAIVGFGLGADMATGYLGQAGDSSVFFALGMISPNSSQDAALQRLQKINIPVLDIYGSRDLAAVASTADDRKRAVMQKAGNPHFRQIEIEGADPFYTGLESSLLGPVRGWLNKHDAGMEAPSESDTR